MSLQCLVNQILNMPDKEAPPPKKPMAEGSASVAYAKAIRSGAMTYSGASCVRCGSCKRYTKNRACVQCDKAGGVYKSEYTIARENKAKAKANGDATYIGRPCKECGGTERRTSTSDCMACQRKAKK